jgi:NAD(P)-dependent dehydrogenase (short-subunit alcohol dehydrogenase family)
MRVFVLGGTGAIGGHVISALVGQGHAVTALARTPATAAVLTAQGATEDAPVDRYPRAEANLAAETSATRFTLPAGWGWCCALAGSTGPAPPTASSCWPWLDGASPWSWAGPTAMCPRSM